MELNKAGLKLIKNAEGWRANAYLDAAGVWTIGYGHTAQIGPPNVTPNMKISRKQGEEILINDLQSVIRDVSKLVTVTLNHNQFSALVSFVYNVGGTNFRKSSVLKAVNQKQFEAVPEKLALWNRAGNKILNGLIRRRAAEGLLFATAVNPHKQKNEIHETRLNRDNVQKRNGKTILQSSINRAGSVLGISVIAALAEDIKKAADAIKNTGNTISEILSWDVITPAIIIIVAAIALCRIIQERRKKSINHGI